MLRKVSVTILTDASGDAVDTTGPLAGKVLAIAYDGNLAADTNFTIVGETSGLPIMAIIDVAASATSWYPRILPNEHADGSSFTDAAGEAPRVYGEKIEITTSDGGNADTGVLTFYLEDDVMFG